MTIFALLILAIAARLEWVHRRTAHWPADPDRHHSTWW